MCSPRNLNKNKIGISGYSEHDINTQITAIKSLAHVVRAKIPSSVRPLHCKRLLKWLTCFQEKVLSWYDNKNIMLWNRLNHFHSKLYFSHRVSMDTRIFCFLFNLSRGLINHNAIIEIHCQMCSVLGPANDWCMARWHVTTIYECMFSYCNTTFDSDLSWC